MANEIFNCEINGLLDKFFDAPDKAALKAALEEKRIQDEKDQKEEAPAASTSSPVESPPSLEEVEDKKEDIEMIEEKV